jgi:hypothetical protein
VINKVSGDGAFPPCAVNAAIPLTYTFVCLFTIHHKAYSDYARFELLSSRELIVNKCGHNIFESDLGNTQLGT